MPTRAPGPIRKELSFVNTGEENEQGQLLTDKPMEIV